MAQNWTTQRLNLSWKDPQEEGLTRADYEGQPFGLHNILTCQPSLTIKANSVHPNAQMQKLSTCMSEQRLQASTSLQNETNHVNYFIKMCTKKKIIVIYSKFGQTVITYVGPNKNSNKQKLLSHS